MKFRTETVSDYQKVYRLNFEAFGQREDESKLIERIRASEQFIPEFSIVAEHDGELIGHVLLSQARITGSAAEHPVLVLAPIAVLPGWQKQGVGGRLIAEGFRRLNWDGPLSFSSGTRRITPDSALSLPAATDLS